MTLSTISGTTTIPVWSTIWPEYACRPLLITTDPGLRFEQEPAGSDGPEDSVRIRQLAPDNPLVKEIANYWLSLELHRCVIKSTIRVDSMNSSDGHQNSVTHEFGGFLRSPSGTAYATQRITSETSSQRRVQRDYVVQFASSL